MQDKEIKILTTYISAWLWRVIGFIFFGFSILFFTLSKVISYNMTFFISFFMVFILCEYQAWRRVVKLRELEEVKDEITTSISN